MRFSNFASFQRVARVVLHLLGFALFSALVLLTRCANYEDVFVNGKIYFVDADCYARMTRARIVAEVPGAVVRHHDFENFPQGVTPHTTAPLDYLIAGLAALLQPFSAQALDLAGALVSPLLALVGGWFLWWWSREFAWPGRLAALLIYALSAILAHGAALGRPDHQALLLVLLLAALGAEWKLQHQASRRWGVVSGISWGLACWVSLYEPLVLLGGGLLGATIFSRPQLLARPRRIGWWIFLALILLAAGIERRFPQWPGGAFIATWAASIGELRSVRLTNPAWLHWAGGLIVLSPVLVVLGWRRRTIPLVSVGLLLLTAGLTLWQARWGYFFVLVFTLTIPAQLKIVRPRWLAALMIALALFPFLQFWDARFWPNDKEAARRTGDRVEAEEWRAAASSLRGARRAPVLTPWWLAPATAYWSGQPVVAGSSHESLPGIVDSARFFLATSPEEAREILRRHGVQWVMAGDGNRAVENSSALLGISPPARVLGRTLDERPSQVPPFLTLAGQNGAAKLYQVRDLR